MMLKDLGPVVEMTPKDDVKGLTLSITERACHKITSLCENGKGEHPDGRSYLQLKVQGGGCAGFQYHIDLVSSCAEDEVYFYVGDITVGIDLSSLEILSGSVIDYEEDMIGSAFVIKNPHAKSSCGCGNSFSMM